MGLLRYQVFLAYGVLFVAVWQALLRQYPDDLVVWILPLVALGLLAIYGISSIAVGVLTFRDTPEAAAELEQQIAEAKAEMKQRGIINSSTRNSKTKQHHEQDT